MKRNSWLLSAIAVAALSKGAVLAQDPKMPVAPAAPVVTSAPVMINGSDPYYYGGDGGGGGGMRVLADVGFMILTPKWKDNPAFFTEKFDNNTENVIASQQDFSFKSQFVPQLSLGATTDSGLGVRMGWWGFAMNNQASTRTSPTTDIAAASPLQLQEVVNQNVGGFGGNNPNKALVASAELRMDVWDFEAVQSFGTGQWAALAAGGMRYAHVSQLYNAVTASGPTGAAPAGPREFLLSGHNFNGAGPTFGLEARRQLGDFGLFLYAKTRASLLYGTSDQEGILGFANQRGGTPPGVLAQASSRSHSFVPEGEVELGAGFSRETRMGVAFLKCGFVAQAWGNIGNSAQSAGIPNFLFDDESSSINRDSTLGLIGFAMSFGIGY